VPDVVRLSALLLSAGVLALAGCGSSSSPSTSSGSPTPSTAATTTAASTTATTATTTATSAPSSGASVSSSASAAPKGDLTLEANPEGMLKYDKTTLTANAGKVSIAFTNHSPLEHNMTIESAATKQVLGATPTFTGGTKVLTLELKAGTYKFFCSVPGHRAAGMEGTLTVK
jgi:plastocyanin